MSTDRQDLFNVLSAEEIQEIGLRLPLRELFNLCRGNTRLNLVLGRDNYFWRRRYLRDIGNSDLFLSNWKEAYRKNINTKVYVFGINHYGQLGIGYTGAVPDLTEINKPIHASTASIGGMHSLVLDTDGKVWGAGYNMFGQIGLPKSIVYSDFVEIPNLRAKAVSASFNHSLFIDLQDEVWVVGNNLDGELGLSRVVERRDFPVPLNKKAKEIATGAHHSLVLDLEGRVWSFGANSLGQLGVGGTNGMSLYQPVPVRGIRNKAEKVFAGYSRSAVIDSEGTVWLFGYTDQGIESSFFPMPIRGIKGKSVAFGTYHILILDTRGTVWGCGSNCAGQLGLKDTTRVNRFVKIFTGARTISASDLHTVIVDLNHSVHLFGKIERANEDKIPLRAKTVVSGCGSIMIIGRSSP